MLFTEKKKYTDDDYMMLNEGAPFQLINYDLIMSPSPNPVHQAIAFRAGLILGVYLESKNDNGYVASETDVTFDDGNILRPDLLYITEKKTSEIVKDRIVGAPDMAIEILSPSTAYYDLRHKKDVYEKFGVSEYIIIDPIAETAELYVLINGTYMLHQKAQKTECLYSVLLHGLSFGLDRLFR